MPYNILIIRDRVTNQEDEFLIFSEIIKIFLLTWINARVFGITFIRDNDLY